MMNNKNQKRFQFLFNSILFLVCATQSVYAANDSSVHKILVDVTQVLLVVAGLLCLGKLIHIGILYMTSSAAEKSQAKTALVPWLVGTIIAFGASWIGPAIINLLKMDQGPLEY